VPYDALPHRFAGRTAIAEVRAAHESLATDAASGASYRLAGRVMARRGQGKLVFLDLEDRSGRLQLLASLDVLGEELLARAGSVSLGDVVGVEGEAIRTRRGELSLQLTGFELLAPNRHPLPDTWHGLSDVELRYRQRYLDLLMSPESRDRFVIRSRAITAFRRFLDERGFLEVETPVLQPLYGGALARPFVTHHNELARDLYLRIATELYLKRLIVGGLEKVYELGKDFRNEGVSFKHNPEFTMLETYEAFADYEDVMRMTEEMVAFSAVAALGTTIVDWKDEPIDLKPPWRRLSLGAALAEHVGFDPLDRSQSSGAPEDALRRALAGDGVDTSQDRTWAQLVDHALSHFIEPGLIQPTFLIDYPVELSPLSRQMPDRPWLTERFEAFCGGMEIANGYSELNDPDEQHARFEEQAQMGRAGDEAAHPIDNDYVNALGYGMPPTGGLGVGIDRVVMLLTGSASIREVVLFPAMRDRPG
jgi:lysyl-tRNA synthetase class 2